MVGATTLPPALGLGAAAATPVGTGTVLLPAAGAAPVSPFIASVTAPVAETAGAGVLLPGATAVQPATGFGALATNSASSLGNFVMNNKMLTLGGLGVAGAALMSDDDSGDDEIEGTYDQPASWEEGYEDPREKRNRAFASGVYSYNYTGGIGKSHFA